MNTTRIEHDLLGEREVPAHRYFGIQTLRATENFNITGITIRHYPRLIESLAYIKKAAALTNQQLGLLDSTIADAICRACDDILANSLPSLQIFPSTHKSSRRGSSTSIPSAARIFFTGGEMSQPMTV